MHTHSISRKRLLTVAWFPLLACLATLSHAADISRAKAHEIVKTVIQPVMQEHRIPGMAIGLVLQNQVYIFNFGLASAADRRPVTDATLFEIGSLSKTFTATLATYAEVTGKLKLSDMVADHLPELTDTAFGNLQLHHLGTHTTGGLPLQVPDQIRNKDQLLSYLQMWKPPYATGTVRTYANPGIGMLGAIAAKSMGKDFSTALHQAVLQPLALKDTYLRVPPEKMERYAFGYTKELVPVRMNPGMLAEEAYGIKTTARDLMRYLQAHMGLQSLDGKLQAALHNTRRAYFRAGDMTQALIWEAYGLPVEAQTLRQGNSGTMIVNPVPVTTLSAHDTPDPHAWINKTGSTNGFGAYLAFIPSQRFGIVVLANRNFPNEERVEIAYTIYKALSR